MDLTSRGYKTFVLGAGEETDPIRTPGAEWYRIKKATPDGLELKLNDRGGWIPTGTADNDSGRIETMQFRNPTAGPITVQLLYGNGFAPKPDKSEITNATLDLDAATQANLKQVDASIQGDVTVAPKAKAKATIIAEKITINKTYQDVLSLSVFNSGTGDITVAGMTIGEQETLEFPRLEPGQLYSDITVDASAANNEATVTGAK